MEAEDETFFFLPMTLLRCCSPHSTITSNTFVKDFPDFVNSYSTVTGIESYTVLVTIPFHSFPDLLTLWKAYVE